MAVGLFNNYKNIRIDRAALRLVSGANTQIVHVPRPKRVMVGKLGLTF